MIGLVMVPGDGALALDPPTVPADSISYAYDELGRLTAVIDPNASSNGVAKYNYDEVGNITSIERLSSAGVSVVQVSPAKGSVGQDVIIYGTGFSATPASNTVTFSGSAGATVTSATETQLHVTVPSGATTGAISVTTPGGSDTSDSFAVVAAPEDPSISSLSSNVADPGATITVSGSDFGASVDKNVVAIGQVRGNVATASSSSLTLPVPAGATSGRVLVATPDGSTTSSSDLFVPPAGFTASQVMTTDRMTIGETNNVVSVTDSSKVALVVFDAEAGDHVFLRVPSATITSTIIKLFDPFGIELKGTSVLSSGGYLDTVHLPTTGTYTILVDPLSGSGNATLSLLDAQPSSGTILANGSAHTITGLTMGQNAVRTFEGSEDQRVFIKAESQMTAIVRLRHPDGWVIGSTTSMSFAAGFIDTKTLDADGTYTIEVDPSGTGTGNVTLTLYDVPADSSGSITAGGSAQTVTISTAGQNGVRTFSGTANQRISLNLTNNSLGSSGACRVKAFIYKPDQSTLVSNTCIGSGGAFIDTQTLPTTGTYSILIDPIDDRTGSITLTLYDVPADSSGSITPGGSAETATLSTPGQNGVRTFSGTANQRIALNLTSVSIGSGLCRAKVFIYKPDASTLASNTCVTSSGAFIDTQTLPTTGTYSILVDPIDAGTGSMTLTLYDVPADSSGSMTIDGGADTMTLSTPGQNGTRTFSGTSSQEITLTITSVSIGSSTCCSAKVSIRRPNGTNLVAPTLFGTTGKTLNPTLDATGTHTIVIDPQDAATGSSTLELTDTGFLAALTTAQPASQVARLGKPRDARRALTTAPLARESAGTAEPANRLRYTPGSTEEWIPTSGEAATWFSGRPESPYESLPALEAEPGVTALAGQVLRLDGLPLPGVLVTARERTTQTDADGRFLLRHLPAGRSVITVDARTANRPDATYGIYEMGVELTAGSTTVLPYTIWSPKLDTAHEIELTYPLTRDVVLTNPRIPGLEVHIPAGSEIHDRQGRLVRRPGITPLPLDRSPFPMPGRFPVYFTVQPGAAYVWPHGVEIVYPNKMHARPGERVEFYSYDPVEKGWYVYGKGTVTPDGKQVRFDPGTRQYELTSAGIGTSQVSPGGPMGGPMGGEPVNLTTGAFVHQHTDIVEPGTPQLEVTRVYRSSDTDSRAFGRGHWMTYSMYLYSDSFHNYNWFELILADQRRIRFERVSPGTDYDDMVLMATETPTDFYRSRIAWNGRAWELTKTDGEIYTFGNGGFLESVRDRFGNQLTVAHSNGPIGDITQVFSSSGRWLKFTYSGSTGRVTQVQDQSGRSVSYAYDGSSRLSTFTDLNGGQTEFTYDTSHRMLTIEDPRNIVYIENEYTNGRVSEQTQADDSTFEFSYAVDGSGNITQTDVTNPRGYVERLTFDSNRYPLTRTLAFGTAVEQTTTYEYDSVTNRLEAATDERDRRTEYEYNEAGRLTRITELAGTLDEISTEFAYEPTYQQLAEINDPLGHGPTLEYDGRGALTKVIDARAKEWTLTPSISGQLIRVTDPLDNETTYDYTLGDLTTVRDPQGASRRMFIDNAGRVVRATDNLGRAASLSYDDADALLGITDPAGNETTIDRDGNGNVATVTDARLHETGFAYDSMDRVESREDPLLELESYDYDGNGNLIKLTDREGQVTTFEYDPLDRLTFAGYGTTGPPESPSYESTIELIYDNGDRLTQAVDSEYGTITHDYDGLDRLTEQETPDGTVSYVYDDADRRETMTVEGETDVDYTYNNADQLTSVTRGSVSAALAYDDASRLESLTLPNGIAQLYVYNAASNIGAITYEEDSSPIGDLIYGYDPVGLRTAMGGSYARTGLPAAVATTDYDAANRLTEWGSQTFSYDDNGNMTGDGTKSYDWNARDELASLTGGGTTASFEYDPFGRRASFTLNSSETRYLYDGDNVVQELVSGSPTADLLSGLAIDELFAVIEPGGTQAVISDALGSTIALADDSGTVQTEYTYEPFGKAAQSGTESVAYQYTGRDNDQTGLQYNRARYYNPAIGRFISGDPLGFGGGDFNLYAYAGNNPVMRTDPSGKNPVVVAGGVILIGVAVCSYFCKPPEETPPPAPVAPAYTPINDTIGFAGTLSRKFGDGTSLIHDRPLFSEKTPLPYLDPPRNVLHGGNIPLHIPPEWTQEELEQLADDLEISLANRRSEMDAHEGGDARHQKRYRDERRLLRQILKRLGKL